MVPNWDGGGAPGFSHLAMATLFALGFCPARFLLDSLFYKLYSRFFRIGTVILALHDTSDVFLEAAKVFKYAEKEMLASISFGCFAVSWLILRLVFFPFWIIKTSSYDTIEYLMKKGQFPKILYYIFNTMLLMLLVFHMYWWKLICAMIIRQLKNRGKVGEDIRSDSEGED
ncbi:hypothetical protein HPP92_015302 [Vanilla planifolia]|uniref:TLC domain-containing protein n=1 Tax=Vanilla planifolia TaxID=51239 RepID=A0A835QNA8_VANPL|nr:hypothetical protein HPP92_015302 [Vanilla planifolia]